VIQRDVPGINFSFLVRLRWGAIAGQVFTIFAVRQFLATALPLGALGTIVGIELLSNLACAAWSRRGGAVRESLIFAIMGADVILLSALLYFTGGPFNPFSFLYLVEIALGSVILRERSTWALVLLALGCSAFLFVAHHELPLPTMSHGAHSEASLNIHLWGMWVAFAVAAAFIVYFLMRVTRALGTRETELARAQERSARAEKLASLATLAAGAAHELATPLSTIALVAKELERTLTAAEFTEAAADARLMREQVERCRTILDQMASSAGTTTGEALVSLSASELLARSVAELAPKPQVRVELPPEAAATRLELPPRAIAQAIRGIVKNAQDASPADHVVVVRAYATSALLTVEVRDAGAGMPAQVLARAGEPFFTTKSPGQGMGLGLFLARAVLERLGGELRLDSTPGRGTIARIGLPVGPMR
jgi:two-component system sensor histidine kinase RegB